MFKFNLPRIVLTCLLATSVWSAKAEPGPSASAWIEIDSGLQITDLQWNKRSRELSEAVRGAIEQRLRAVSFEPSPAHAEGKRFGTTVTLDTRLDGDGETVVLSLSKLSSGIGYAKIKPPRYPVTGLRRRQQADVLAGVAVSEDGRAQSIELISSPAGQEYFESEVRSAIESWQFKNETVDGKPVPGRIIIPLRFSMHCSRGGKGFELESAAPTPVVTVQNDQISIPNHADVIEITATRQMGGPRACDEGAD